MDHGVALVDVFLAACRTSSGTLHGRVDQIDQRLEERKLMSHFRQWDGDTTYLLPPSVDDWLPKDGLARRAKGGMPRVLHGPTGRRGAETTDEPAPARHVSVSLKRNG